MLPLPVLLSTALAVPVYSAVVQCRAAGVVAKEAESGNHTVNTEQTEETLTSVEVPVIRCECSASGNPEPKGEEWCCTSLQHCQKCPPQCSSSAFTGRRIHSKLPLCLTRRLNLFEN
jgi:hypothetical protein